ncbi:MAG TPA: group I intron-associated PD-(D/E)XK endonuclease [Candidatus Eremiobacteraceae bacterium]|nr:group I intron-associated PD-(D/E)XK endonuclease [Candidatus Eremiobacteraceae bacterium]
MKKNRYAGMNITNRKKRGEWAEAVFAERTIREGLPLAKPWGDSFGYDFMVEQDNARIVRVQVKSTTFREGEGYSCTLQSSRGRGPYTKNSFEFVAAYVIPEDLWYILPEKKVRGMWSVALHPELKKSKFSEYQEAWHLLHGPLPGLIARIEAVADEDFPEV